MSKLSDLLATADEIAPSDTTQTKLGALLSSGTATPPTSDFSQTKLGALLGQEQGQASKRGAQGTNGQPSSEGLSALFGSGPVPDPFLALRQVPEGFPGHGIAQFAGNLPGNVAEAIKSTGRALTKVPREALRTVQQFGTTGGLPPVQLIKQQAEDLMRAQSGDQDAQARLDARNLMNSLLVGGIAAPVAAGAPLATRLLAGGGSAAAQTALMAASEGRAPGLGELGMSAAFGAIPGFHGEPHIPGPVPGITPQAVMSAETQYAAKNLLEKLRSSRPLIGAQRKLRRAELGQRAGRMAQAAEGLTGRERLGAELQQLRGKLPRVDFDPLNLSPEDEGQLFSHLENLEASGQLKQFQGVNARRALQSLLGEGGGALPRPYEVKLLGKAFGAQFGDELARKGAVIAELKGSKDIPQWRQLLKTTIGTTRELKTTADLSAPLRQGFFLISHPREFFSSFAKMHKFAISQGAFDDAMSQIKQRNSYPLMLESGLDFADVGGPLQKVREEVFQGGFLERLPRKFGGGVFRGSQRAYTGFLNQLRADVFDDMLRQGSKLGIHPEDAAKHVADFVNTATGRGKLPGVLERNMELLSTFFFAPRLYASRVALLGTPLSYIKSLASGDKAYRFVRQQAMKDFIVMGGLASTMLTLAAGAGAKVNSDLTNSDYGKARIGKQTVDLLGGGGQFIRAGARIQAEMAYADQTGKKGAQGQVLGRFARSKLSPIAQFATDMFLKEDYLGNKVTLPSALKNLFSPLALGDAIQAIQDNPTTAAVTVPLGLYGAGQQVYPEPQPYQVGKKGY